MAIFAFTSVVAWIFDQGFAVLVDHISTCSRFPKCWILPRGSCTDHSKYMAKTFISIPMTAPIITSWCSGKVDR